MSLVGWLALAAYVACYVAGFRWTLREYAEDFAPMDGIEFAAGLMLSAVFASFGPLYVVYKVVALGWTRKGLDADAIARKIAGEDRGAKIARREAAVEERERHVKDLEREMGV